MPGMLQNVLIYAGSFVVVLSVVVFVHEFGHFQVAKWRKVAIDTFSIGFGKTLFGWRDKQGVQWKVGALPLGGYVKFADDADALSTAPAEQIDDPVAKADARRRGLFHAQPLTTRAMVVAAGPLTNFLFSIFAFAVFAFASGRDVTDYNAVRPYITGVAPASAAATAGVQEGDLVEAVNGAQVRGLRMFQTIIAAHPDQAVELTLLQANGGTRIITATPRAVERPGPNGAVERIGSLGVNLGVLPEDRVVEPVGVFAALQFGAGNTWGIIVTTVRLYRRCFHGPPFRSRYRRPARYFERIRTIRDCRARCAAELARRPDRHACSDFTRSCRDAFGRGWNRQPAANPHPRWRAFALLLDRSIAWRQAFAADCARMGLSRWIRRNGEPVPVCDLE